MNTEEVFYYHNYYGNRFIFLNKNGNKKLEFVPFLKSKIEKEMTIAQILKAECELIMLNGKKIN